MSASSRSSASIPSSAALRAALENGVRGNGELDGWDGRTKRFEGLGGADELGVLLEGGTNLLGPGV